PMDLVAACMGRLGSAAGRYWSTNRRRARLTIRQTGSVVATDSNGQKLRAFFIFQPIQQAGDCATHDPTMMLPTHHDQAVNELNSYVLPLHALGSARSPRPARRRRSATTESV